jgi:streptogramin lyase
MTRQLTPLALLVVTTVGLASTAGPTISTFAGTGMPGNAGDGGPAALAQLRDPFDVALDRAGNLYFSDTSNHSIRRIDVRTGVISTIAGSGRKGFSGDGGPATQATMNEPYGLALDTDGHLFIVDRLNARVRLVDGKSGIIRTVAGTGQPGYSGDGGPGDKAQLREPNGVALDGKGQLYITDVADQRVRVVALDTGIITTFCGTGRKEQTGDGGPYQQASLLGPRAVAVGPDGGVYICEREGNSIRRVNRTTGMIERYAGTGTRGYTGDGGPAVRATFNGPKEIKIDAADNVWVVDTENHAIRRIDARTGVVTTVAGTGRAGGTGDGGPALQGMLNRPHGVAVAPDGTIYIGDTLNHRIRKVQ